MLSPGWGGAGTSRAESGGAAEHPAGWGVVPHCAGRPSPKLPLDRRDDAGECGCRSQVGGKYGTLTRVGSCVYGRHLMNS